MSPASEVSALHIVLAGAIAVAALLALYVPRRITAVVMFLVFGVLLSVYWALAGAPDVALAEAVLGTGVTGALFGYLVTVLPGKTVPATAVRTAAGIVVGLLGGVGFGLVLTRDAGTGGDDVGLTTTVMDRMGETGVDHPITAVLLNLRSWDTLLEMVVLLVAATIAVGFLAPSTEETSTASDHDGGDRAAPGLIVRVFVSLVAPVIVALAAWLLFAGSTRPGGAFQAGAALAAVLILVHVARVAPLRLSRLMHAGLIAGVAAFLLVAAAGLVFASAWLELRGDGAGPVIVVLESLLALSIGATLAVVFLANTVPAREPA